MRAFWLAVVFGALLPVAATAQRQAAPPYATGYFGEPLTGLSIDQRASFDRGYLLFVKEWPLQSGALRNAESCVSCHSAPMPGGSGMSNQALVAVRSSQAGTEILPIDSSHGSAERRRTPALFGLGLLEFADSRVGADGKTRPIFGALQDTQTLEEFVAKAFFVELGVQSRAQCAQRQARTSELCRDGITDAELADVVAYIRFLAPPPRHGEITSTGRKIFLEAGCGTCHTEIIVTRVDAPVPIAGHAVAAYTDLSRHNLGQMDVRTTALWGVNSTGPPYMHDGNANDLGGAIAAHGGAASNSRDLFLALRPSEKDQLLEFLRSL